MDTIIRDIVDALRAAPGESRLDSRSVQAIVRAHNEGRARNQDHYAKKQLLPFYLGVKSRDPELWASWGLDAALEARLLATLQVKPRRTASGVATVTVITRPAPCGNACGYCPSDVRMPKSYLHDEPACQRAERNFFDPYLQVVSRARALYEMGHSIDKIELIVLGGTWCDYPEDYQRWFATELFRACNDLAAELVCDGSGARPAQGHSAQRRAYYQGLGLTADPDVLAQEAAALQDDVTAGRMTYNAAVACRYGAGSPWHEAGRIMHASLAELEEAQRANEGARHRVVGFVVETRPDTITVRGLALLRALGCTKVQMGIQSLDPAVLAANRRPTDAATVERALGLTRLFGFKLHTHFMVNLAGATPDGDRADYRTFVTEPAYLPDEVKLYPCALVAGTDLCRLYEQGLWRPYTEEELLGVLCDDVLATPAYCRISRMIRDISAGDILVGNKKTNLRQMVEQRLERHVRDVEAGSVPGGAQATGVQAADAVGAQEGGAMLPVKSAAAANDGVRDDGVVPATSGMAVPGRAVREIRMREISTDCVDLSALELEDVSYETTLTSEHFLQWVTPEGKIAGFLRLSLPHAGALDGLAAALSQAALEQDAPRVSEASPELGGYGSHGAPAFPDVSPTPDALPLPNASQAPGTQPSAPSVRAAVALTPGSAMIREVHVYGRAAHLGAHVDGAQHTGLGRRLVARAEQIARGTGYARLNVISAIGTREYYRRLGFSQVGLYQQKQL